MRNRLSALTRASLDRISDDQRQLVFPLSSPCLPASVFFSECFFLEKRLYETKWKLILSRAIHGSLEDSGAREIDERTQWANIVARTRVVRSAHSFQRSTVQRLTSPNMR